MKVVGKRSASHGANITLDSLDDAPGHSSPERSTVALRISGGLIDRRRCDRDQVGNFGIPDVAARPHHKPRRRIAATVRRKVVARRLAVAIDPPMVHMTAMIMSAT